MSSPKRLSAKFPSWAISIALGALYFVGIKPVLAEHDHGACPDYGEYRNVLEKGRLEAQSSSSATSTQSVSRSTTRGAFVYGNVYENYAYKDSNLQKYIGYAVSAEDSGNIEQALNWWLAADEQVQKKDSDLERSYVHSLVLSRMADLNVIRSQHIDVELSADDLPYLNWEEANNLLKQCPSELEWQYSLHRKKFKEASEMLSKRKPTVVGIPWTRSLGTATAPDFISSRAHRDIAILCHVPFPSKWIQPKLMFSLENCQIKGLNSKAEAENRLLLEDALRNYKESTRIRKQQPDNGSNALCIMDLVKSAIIERTLGRPSDSKKSLDDAIARITASAETNLPVYLFVDDIQANLLSSKLFYQLVSRELSSHALKNLSPSHAKVVEDELSHYAPRRWGASVIAAYAAMGDKANTVRVFKVAGKDVFSPDTNKVQIGEERLAIGRALIDVGAFDEFKEFVSAWDLCVLREAPQNIFVQAFNNSALASLYLRRGDRSAVLKYLREFVRSANLLPDGDRSATQVRFDTYSKLCADIEGFSSKVAANSNDAAAIREAEELETLESKIRTLSANSAQRLQTLKCLELSEDLMSTAAGLSSKGKFDEAAKLLDAAIDIRTKNLGASDSQTIDAQIQVARMFIVADRLPQAAKRLELITESMRKAEVKDIDQFRMVLEMYADVLAKTQRTADSDEIYSELRSLKDGNKLAPLEAPLGLETDIRG